MPGLLIESPSLEGPDGLDVPLAIPGYRRVTRAEGLAGMRVRSLVLPRPGRHGSRNRSRYRDDALITLQGIVLGEDAARAWMEYDKVVTALAGCVDTDRLLKWRAGDRLLQSLVRLDGMEAPVEVGPDRIAYSATLRASDPAGYSQTEKTATTVPATAGGGGGTYPDTYPATYQPATGGVLQAVNAGTVPTPLLLLLTGELTDPIIRLDDDPLRQLVLTGTIANGDVLTIDGRADPRTVTLNGTANRLNLLTFESSTWFDLPVGAHTIRLLASSFAGSAQLEARWRDAYE